MAKINSPITTIPGIGPVLGAIIISEFGDINRFDKPSKLVAFAGIDATVSQSGEFEGTHNVMSKRGSPYLRKALFQAALVASNSDPVLKDYYQKKRAEGKHHKTCIGAVARKMCNIIYSVLKNNKPYEVPKNSTFKIQYKLNVNDFMSISSFIKHAHFLFKIFLVFFKKDLTSYSWSFIKCKKSICQ